MPSLSSKTRVKRAAKLRKAGRRRKRLLRHGSTPTFPIHLEENEEQKEGKKKSKKKV